MAWGFNALTVSSDMTAGVQDFTTAAVTASAGSLLIAVVGGETLPASSPTFGWTSGSAWTEIAYHDSSASAGTVWIRVYMYTEPSGKSSTTLSYTHGGTDTHNGIAWFVFELTGADVATLGIGDQPVQTSEIDAGTGVQVLRNPLAGSISPAMTAGNASVCAFIQGSGNYNGDAHTNWTEVGADQAAVDRFGLNVQYRLDIDTYCETDWGGPAAGNASILMEIAAESSASAAVSGTATASMTESDVVSGGKTIIITLTGDTWVAA